MQSIPPIDIGAVFLRR